MRIRSSLFSLALAFALVGGGVSNVEAVNKFVCSSQTAGTCPASAPEGECWEDSYDTFMRNWSSESNFTASTDVVYVCESHTQTAAADLELYGPIGGHPVVILCVEGNATGTDPGALCDGSPSYPDETASATNTGITYRGNLWVYGPDFIAGDSMLFATVDSMMHFEQCSMELTTNSASDDFIFGAGADGPHETRFVNCDFNVANSGSSFSAFGRAAAVYWEGGTLDANMDPMFSIDDCRGCRFEFSDVDLTNFTGALTDSDDDTAIADILISRAKMGSSWSMETSIESPDVRVEVYNTQVGTLTDPSLHFEGAAMEGKWELDTARYKTSGGGAASDGTQNYSISVDTTDAVDISFYNPLRVHLVDFYLEGDGTSNTARFYLAAGASVTDAQAWIGCSIFDDGAKTSLGKRVSSRAAPLASGTTITADPGGDTWTGTDESAEMVVDLTLAPDDKGVVSCDYYQAVDNERISVSPLPELNP